MKQGGARGDVVIAGMACRLPGADSPQAAWDLIDAGEHAITEAPPERWAGRRRVAQQNNARVQSFPKWGGYLDGIDQFDAKFFGISAREARLIDPQQRLLMQTSWQAIESLGIHPEDFKGTRTGVFVGISTFDYMQRQMLDTEELNVDAYSSLGAAHSIAANRLSYFYDFTGPSLAVDTACSSGSVALHLARKSLLAGECDYALVGGVNVIVSPLSTISFSKARMLSPDGRCKSFDARADGYVRSEGCVTMVLTREEIARRDGRHVHAIVRGSAINQDGKTLSITTPNGDAQQAAVRSALDDAGLTPNDIDFVEAHGTGTTVGDAIEFEALHGVFSENRSGKSDVLVGAAKPHFGHLEAASGLVGVLKAVNSLRTGSVPGLPFLEQPIDENLDGHLRLARTTTNLNTADAPLRAGVSCFGFGGANAHIIIEAPETKRDDYQGVAGVDSIQVLPVASHSPAALAATAADYLELVRADTALDLAALCSRVRTQRAKYAVRRGVVFASRDELIAGLEKIAQSDNAQATIPDSGELAFCFSGQGAQFAGMCQRLLDTDPVYRETINACDALTQEHGDFSLLDILNAAEDDTRINETRFAQPALFAVNIALARSLMAHGAAPDCVIGHSLGEIVAACVAEVMDLTTAMQLVLARGAFMASAAGDGAMLSLSGKAEELEAFLADIDELEISGRNTPSNVTLSGPTDAIDKASDAAEQLGLKTLKLAVSHAFHSRMMDPVLEDFAKSLENMHFAAPKMRIISNVTGQIVDDRSAMDAAYWVRHIRQPVEFEQGVKSLLALDIGTIVEIGPQPILMPWLRALSKDRERKVNILACLPRNRDDLLGLTGTLAKLYESGVDLTWDDVQAPAAQLINLPPYRFANETYWFKGDDDTSTSGLGGNTANGGAALAVFDFAADDNNNLLEQHRVGGRAIVPGALYIDMMARAAQKLFGADSFVLEDGRIPNSLTLSEASNGRLVATALPQGSGVWGLAVHLTGSGDGRDKLVAHATAHKCEIEPDTRDIGAMEPGLTEVLAHGDLYTSLEDSGLNYGPAFRGVQEVHFGGGRALAQLIAPQPKSVGPGTLDACLFDACLQVAGGALKSMDAAAAANLWVPTGFDRLTVFDRLPQNARTHAQLDDGPSFPHLKTFDIAVMDEAGAERLLLEGLSVRRIETSQSRAANTGPLFTLEDVAAPETMPTAPEDWQKNWVVTQLGGAGLDAIIAAQLDAPQLVEAQQIAEVKSANTFAIVFDEETPTNAKLVSEFVRMVGQIAKHHKSGARLVAVFRAHSDAASNETAEAMRAVMRVLRNESPWLKPVSVRVAAKADNSVLSDALHTALSLAEEPDQNWHHGTLKLRRLSPTPLPAKAWTPAETAGPEKFLMPGTNAGIANLTLAHSPVPVCGDDDVMISPEAAGLNFRDVLKVLRLYPNRPGLPLWLGDECVGIVRKTGRNVKNVKAGDRVMAVAPRAFATSFTAPHTSVVKLPNGLDPVAAATIPIAFSTAWYGLVDLGQLTANDTVLIHAAAGGVGLAGVQIAQHIGARVIATAGSEEKHEYLRGLGIETIGNSRDLSFVDVVREATDGQGVDVVLNSLAGPAIEASVELLKPFGRFVDIGKRDIVEGNNLGLRPFHKSISFHSLDMELLFAQVPAKAQALLNDIAEAFEKNELAPLPHTEFALEDAAEGFQYMAGAKNIGKVVITVDRNALVDAAAVAPRDTLHDAALVTGAFGALGVELVTHLAASGVRNFVLLGRSEPKPAVREVLDRLEANGARILANQADVANIEALSGAFDAAAKDGLTIRHIYHAAGALADAMIADTDETHIDLAWGAKVLGAEHLDRISRDPKRNLDIESFVCLSSISTVLGSPGQSAYAAANAALDALCTRRVAEGLAAKSLSLGPWLAGLAQLDPETTARFDRFGLRNFTITDGMGVLFKALNAPGATNVVARLTSQKFGAALPAIANLTVCADLYQRGASGAGAVSGMRSPILKKLIEAEADLRAGVLVEYLREKLAGVMSQPIDDIAVDVPLEALGFDSLAGLEFAMVVEEETGASFPMEAIGDTTSLSDISKLLVAAIDFDAAPVEALSEERDENAPQADATMSAIATSPTIANHMPIVDAESFAGNFNDYIDTIRPDFTRFLKPLGLAVDYDHAQGDLLSGSSGGKRIEVVDFVGGYGSCLFGHNHPQIIGAAMQVLASGRPTHAQGSVRAPSGLLAKDLSDTLAAEVGGDFAVALANSGAEAIEGALKHAIVEYAARLRAFGVDLSTSDAPPELAPIFLAIEGSYHGKTLGALSIGHFRYWPRGVGGMQVISVPRNDPKALDAILEQARLSFGDTSISTIAGAFVEPVQGEGGVHPLNSEFLAALRQGADAEGFPLVFDEIQSGFYRCGALAASHNAGVAADYYTFGKSLGGGVAKISALLVRRERYQDGFGMLQSSTNAEDDFSSQAALAALRLAKSENIGARAIERGLVLRAKLDALAEAYPDIVAQVRGEGLMLGLELKSDVEWPSGLLSNLADKELLGQMVCSHLLVRDKIRVATTLSSPNTIRLQPSAFVSDAHVNALHAAFERVFTALRHLDGAYLVSHLLDRDRWLSDSVALKDAPPSPDIGVPGAGKQKVAFLIHVADDDAVLRWDPSWARMSADDRQSLNEQLAPLAAASLVRIANVTGANGGDVEIHFMSLFASAQTIENAMRRGEAQWVIDQVQGAAEAAADSGCHLMGLGGFLSIVTRNGQRLDDSRMAYTTGNALTIAMGISGIEREISRHFDGTDIRIGILGAVGNIGSSYARRLAEMYDKLALVGRSGSMVRLQALADQIQADAAKNKRTAPTIEIFDDINALGDCNVIVSATNSALPVIHPEHIGTGPVVILDISVPPSVSTDVAAQRQDVHVVPGSLVQVPSTDSLDLTPFGLPAGQMYACMAETAVLGLEGLAGNYSIGDVRLEQIAEISELADRNGFVLGDDVTTTETSAQKPSNEQRVSAPELE